MNRESRRQAILASLRAQEEQRKAEMRERQRQARRQVARRLAASVPKPGLFDHRGFTERTIKALIAAGIEFPECLLSIDEAAISDLPGIGAAALREMRTYKAIIDGAIIVARTSRSYGKRRRTAAVAA